MSTEFRLPELGENITSGDLVRVLVSAGDAVRQDQPVLELETDKATIEVPSPVSGVVQQIYVKDGQKINVGQLIFTVDGESAQGGERKQETRKKVREAAADKAIDRAEKKVEVIHELPRRPALERMESVRETPHEPPTSEVEAPPMLQVVETLPRVASPAAPSVRRVAREIGVEINEVSGSGPGGRISGEDVKRYARAVMASRRAGAPIPASAPLPDFQKWGEVERKPVTQIRLKTAERMSRAWATIPQVTQFDEADITDLEEMRKHYSKSVEAAGGKLTATAIAVKVSASALRLFPQFAASFDAERSEIVYKKYCHIGVALDTDRGLLVPVIRNADQKNITQIAKELTALAEKGRSRKLTLEEMDGSVFTISNLGGIGGTNFSPIVNFPEAAILGISRSRPEPVYVGERLEPRLKLPLALSYDHRLIDGADAARFLRWVAEAFEQPFLLPLQG